MTSLSLRGLTGKLLLGQVLVLLAGATTVVVVAFALEPGLIGSDGDGNFGPRQVLVAFGASLVVAAVIVLALSVLLSLRLVRPIREAADAAERIAQGQRGVRVSVPSSDDELAQLTDAFNRMAVSVEDGERRRAQLVADVAHELRTPLTTIDGYLEGVEDELVPADPSTWTLLRDQTARLRRLAEDLALLARVEERRVDLELEPVSVARLIDRAAAAARPAFDVKGVTIRTNADRPAGNTRVVADAGRIGDVLANLLANALRHSNPENDVLIEATRTRDTVTITVADHGDGIAPDDLEHIFDRLYRTDQARTRDAGGSGLGLAISRAIVEAHEGTIKAESPGLGQGASLTITLPAAAAG